MFYVLLLFLKQIRLQYNLVFLNLPYAEGRESFIEIVVHEICQLQGTFAAQFFQRRGIHMAEDKAECLLAVKAEGIQIRAMGKDIAQFDMLVFQASFLSGLHGIAEEHPCTPGTVGGGFHGICRGEFTSPVRQKDMDVFAEDLRSQNGFKKVNAVFHAQCGFGTVEHSKEDTGIYELECLEERTSGFIVVHSIHLCDEHIRVLNHISLIVLIGPPQKVSVVGSFLVGSSLFPGNPAGDLPAQIQGGNACDFMEDTVFNVVIHGLFRNAEFGVDLQYLVWGKPLFEERSNDGSHIPGFRHSEVHTLPGVDKRFPVIELCLFRGIGVLVEAAAAPAGTAIAGAGGAVPSGTTEGNVVGTVGSTLAPMDTFAISITFEREAAFVGKDSVKFDLFANSGLVLANGLCNGSFCGTVGDASQDDTAFLQGKVGKGIIITHVKYLPFRRLPGTLSVRLNTTFVEVEICERLKSTLPPSKWK